MSPPPAILCPHCGGALVGPYADRLTCASCARSFPRAHGCDDLRRDPERRIEPAPLRAADFDAPFRAQEAGTPYTPALEEFLRALSVVDADRLMQILGEGRGAWFTLLGVPAGDLLFAGNALSGTVAALCAGGFRVTVLDPSPERARYGQWRNAAHGHADVRSLVAGDAPTLPFGDASFDVVVREGGFPRATPPFAFDLDECRRVCRGELAVVGNNRFGYKRSTGRRSIHYVPGPLEYAAGALVPREGERTLGGHRRAVAGAGFERPRAFALYPHASDYTHVVALDGPYPSLTIGPMERRNVLKLAARAAGLFSVLTPSYLLISRREDRSSSAFRSDRSSSRHRDDASPRLRDDSSSKLRDDPTSRLRIGRVLAELAERTGEPRPTVERLISTRGQSSVVLTRVEDAPAGGPGSWTLHLPFSPANVVKTARRHAALATLRVRFPWLPVPEPLFHGRADGVLLSCERRLPGRTAPEICGDRGPSVRMLDEVAAHFARLSVRPAARFSEDDFEALIGSRFDVAGAKAVVPSTLAELARLSAATRERLVGKSIPRVFYHTDLRAKHVQIDQDGGVVGYLDWSTSEEEFLPCQDLFNLIVHNRKQEDGISAGDAWRATRDRRDVRGFELDALERYRAAVGIDEETARAIEAIHPVLVAAMAEKCWSYSLPFWLHRQFGL